MLRAVFAFLEVICLAKSIHKRPNDLTIGIFTSDTGKLVTPSRTGRLT